MSFIMSEVNDFLNMFKSFLNVFFLWIVHYVLCPLWESGIIEHCLLWSSCSCHAGIFSFYKLIFINLFFYDFMIFFLKIKVSYIEAEYICGISTMVTQISWFMWDSSFLAGDRLLSGNVLQCYLLCFAELCWVPKGFLCTWHFYLN